MRFLYWLFTLTAALAVGSPAPAWATCAPEKMVRLVIRDVTPSSAGTFAAQPKTIYRLGSHYARVEERPDPELGIHGLLVTNQRDHWMVDLVSSTGRHLVDTAENFDVHVSVVGWVDSPLVKLEYGCEVEFMAANGIVPGRVQVGERSLLSYEITDGTTQVRLLVQPDSGVPWAVGVVEDGQPIYLVRYDEYEAGLAPDDTLFARPPGIEIVDSDTGTGTTPPDRGSVGSPGITCPLNRAPLALPGRGSAEMQPEHDAPPLGGLSAAAFLERHWQKTPLLIRGALSGHDIPFGVADLKRLATRAGVRSRLITPPRGGAGGAVQNGPFKPAELRALPKAGWSLLVHEVDRHVDAFSHLLERFRFVPNWRIDDVMVSLAPDGGGVGPHRDRYDVFLLQGQGRRRWRIREAPLTGTEQSIDQGGVRSLVGVQFDREYVVEPGDMLYLPPGVPHEGIALGDGCMTYSIGFRAPDPRELCASFLTQLPPEAFDAIRYSDPDLQPAVDAGEISAAARQRLRDAAAGLFREGGDFDRWVGCYTTRPLREPPSTASPGVRSPDELRERLERGAVLHRSAPPHFAWFEDADDVLLFVGGESYPLGAGSEARAQAEALCGRRRLDAQTLAPWLGDGRLAGILMDLIVRGYLTLHEGPADAD